MQIGSQEGNNTDTKKIIFADWNNAGAVSINNYQVAMDSLLIFINITNLQCILLLIMHTLKMEMCTAVLMIITILLWSALSTVCKMSLPFRHIGRCNEYNKSGWNDYVHEKHSMAYNAFMQWIMTGRPHFGYEYMWMRRTCAQFKLALWFFEQHEDLIHADAYATSLTETTINLGIS